MRIKNLFIGFFVFSLFFILIFGQSCTYEFEGWHWDLSPLIAPTGGKDYTIKDVVYTYYWNYCANVLSYPFSCGGPNVAYFTFNEIGGCIDYGPSSNLAWSPIDPSSPKTGVVIRYTGTAGDCEGGTQITLTIEKIFAMRQLPLRIHIT